MNNKIEHKLQKLRQELAKEISYHDTARKQYYTAKEMGEDKIKLRRRQSSLTFTSNTIKYLQKEIKRLEDCSENKHFSQPPEFSLEERISSLEERVEILEEQVQELLEKFQQ